MEEINSAITKLAEICERLPLEFKKINERDLNVHPQPGKWTKKQILGHLIDSAANNHQRFVRIQFEDNPVISYEQDQWVAAQNYNDADTGNLIQLWKACNLHLLHIIKNIQSENLEKKGALRSGASHSLGWYINDYVAHLEHHLSQLFGTWPVNSTNNHQ